MKIILGHSVNMYSFSLQLEMSVSIKGDTQMLEFGNEIYHERGLKQVVILRLGKEITLIPSP